MKFLGMFEIYIWCITHITENISCNYQNTLVVSCLVKIISSNIISLKKINNINYLVKILV